MLSEKYENIAQYYLKKIHLSLLPNVYDDTEISYLSIVNISNTT
jgi:hypothetical protein